MRILNCLRSCFGLSNVAELPASRPTSVTSLGAATDKALTDSASIAGAALTADRISYPPALDGSIPFLDQLIISKFPTVTDSKFLKAVNEAKASGDLQPLKEILCQKEASVSPRGFSLALIEFAKDKNVAALQLLLANGRADKLTYESFVELIKSVINSSDSDTREIQTTLNCLLSARKGFPQDLIEKLVSYAALKGNKEALKTLLKGHTLSSQGLKNALIEAITHFSDLSLVEFLLKDRIEEMELGDLCSVLDAASEFGLFDVIEMIYKNKDGEHSFEVRFLAAKIVLRRKDNGSYRRLTDGITFSQCQIIEFLNVAIGSSSSEIVRELLPKINYAELNWFESLELIRFVVKQGWHEILREILPQVSPINSDSVNSLMESFPDSRMRAIFSEAGYFFSRKGTLELSLEGLKENPQKWLKDLVDNGMPEMIRFTDSSIAIDVGGLTKQFVTTLIEGVVEKELIAISDTGIVKCQSDEQEATLLQIGRLYAMIDAKNTGRTDPILTGCLLHPRFLEFVKIAGSNRTADEKIIATALLLKEIFPTRTNDVNLLIDPSEENKRVWMEALYVDEVTDEDIQELKKEFQTYLRAALAFYNGSSVRLRAKIATDTPTRVLEAIQGQAISAEKIIKSLMLDSSDSALRAKAEWIKVKIRSADQAFLTKFVMAITGKKSISPTDCIKLKINGIPTEPETFRIHTCFNTIDLPQAPMSEEDFLIGLEGCLDDYFQDA